MFKIIDAIFFNKEDNFRGIWKLAVIVGSVVAFYYGSNLDGISEIELAKMQAELE